VVISRAKLGILDKSEAATRLDADPLPDSEIFATR